MLLFFIVLLIVNLFIYTNIPCIFVGSWLYPSTSNSNSNQITTSSSPVADNSTMFIIHIHHHHTNDRWTVERSYEEFVIFT